MTKNGIVCAQCGGPVTFAKGDAKGDNFVPGDYRVVAISREGAGYWRSAAYPNVYAHLGECEAAWRAANGNGAPAAVTAAEVQNGTK